MIQIKYFLVLTLLALVLFNTTILSAEESSPENGWEFAAEAYLWGASIGGDSASDSIIDIDFDDVFDNLEIAFMGVIGARKGKWSFMADIIYLDVDDSTHKKGIKTEVELTSWIITPVVAYTVLSGKKGHLDLHAGVRYFYLDVDVGLGRDNIDDSDHIWDGIIGLQGKINMTERLYLRYYFDIGTGDSKTTWQAIGGLEYQFKFLDLIAGYRYLKWDFDNSPVFNDLTLSGPYVGLKFYF